jgi:hypothetical protein
MRKEMREKAWQLDGWADTVHKARLFASLVQSLFFAKLDAQTAQLARTMDSLILTPLPFSPLK